MHNLLYSGILRPYLRKDIPFLPHITLGFFGINNDFNRESYKRAYVKAKKMNLNINCNFDNLTLVKGDGLSPAKIIKKFELTFKQ